MNLGLKKVHITPCLSNLQLRWSRHRRRAAGGASVMNMYGSIGRGRRTTEGGERKGLWKEWNGERERGVNLAELAERGGECKDIGHDIHQPQGAELAAAREGGGSRGEKTLFQGQRK